MKKNKGFTLIELLVVIAIIGLLSSVVMASLNSARAKARDTARKQSLVQLRNALQMYFADNGSFPVTDESINGGWYGSEPDDTYTVEDLDYIPGLAPQYISKLPRDPRGGDSKIIDNGNGQCVSEDGSVNSKAAFLYKSDGTRYKLLSHCAPEGVMSTSDVFYDPQRSNWAWQVCSDETSCTTW